MQLFSGLDKSDYQDVLRALGFYFDERGLRNVRIIEVDDGLLVQGVQGEAGSAVRVETQLIRDDDLRDLLREAYKRRRPTRPAPETDRPAYLLPHGDVLFRPGHTALSVTVHNHGAGPARQVEVFARWRNLVLSASVPAIESRSEAAVVLEPAQAAAGAMMDELGDVVMRLRLRYRDLTGTQFDMLCDYGHDGGGWRVTKLPAVRGRGGAG